MPLRPAEGIFPLPNVELLAELRNAARHFRAGESALAELASLEREPDPEMFWEGLLDFGLRQELGGNVPFAVRVYAAIGEAPGGLPAGPENFQALQRRARERLDGILGQGSVGPRAEFLLRRLAQESCEPTSLLAMGLNVEKAYARNPHPQREFLGTERVFPK